MVDLLLLKKLWMDSKVECSNLEVKVVIVSFVVFFDIESISIQVKIVFESFFTENKECFYVKKFSKAL